MNDIHKEIMVHQYRISDLMREAEQSRLARQNGSQNSLKSPHKAVMQSLYSVLKRVRQVQGDLSA